MGFTAAAILGGSVISGVLGTRAADKAADAQVAAGDRAIEEDRRQYEQTRTDLAPWRQTGEEALGRLDRASSGDMSDFYASPDYNFRRTEGMRDLGNQFSVRGGGGNAMKALNEYNSNLAGGEYGDWWNRQAGLSGAGQGATNATAAYGAQSSRGISNAMIGQGNARASGIHGAYGSVNNAVQGGINNWMYYKGMNPGDTGETEYDFQGRPIRKTPIGGP